MKQDKKTVIARYLKDAESKAESLYRKGYALGRESGSNEAWETLREMANMPYEEFVEAFDGFECIADVVRSKDKEVVVQMLDDYKCLKAIRKKAPTEIKPGDEVVDSNGLIGLVTNTDTHYHIYYPHNGKTWKAPKSAELTRTGRTFGNVTFEYDTEELRDGTR